MNIHDVTLTLTAGMAVWPGDPPFRRTLWATLGDASSANVSQVSMSVHTGTHVDAPIHFIAGGAAIEALDLSILTGPCHVCRVQPAGKHISAGDLDALDLSASCQRLLLKTANSQRWTSMSAPFYENFIALTLDAAQWVVERGIGLIGVDYLSVEPMHNTEPVVHRTLLNGGVVPREGLNLAAVAPGEYMLVCLPLKIAGSDGAPARVILMET